jgi:hypothetical protein
MSSLQAAREALTEKVFVKGPDYKNKFGVVFGDGLVTSAGEKHKGESAHIALTISRTGGGQSQRRRDTIM